jgi:hypothetical protein
LALWRTVWMRALRKRNSTGQREAHRREKESE